MKRRSGSPSAAVDDVVVPDLLAERAGRLGSAMAVLLVSHLSETLISRRGTECKRRRRPRQGGSGARRVGGRAAGSRPTSSRPPSCRARPRIDWPWRSKCTDSFGATTTGASCSACGWSSSGGPPPTRSRWPRRPRGRWRSCGTRRARACSCTCGTVTGACASRRSSRRTACARSCRWGRACRSTSARPAASCRRPRPVGTESAQILRPWVESVGEREAGVASVSAPVLDASGTVVAAVSVSGPIERTSRHPAASTPTQWSRRPIASSATPAFVRAPDRSPSSPAAFAHQVGKRRISRRRWANTASGFDPSLLVFDLDHEGCEARHGRGRRGSQPEPGRVRSPRFGHARPL